MRCWPFILALAVLSCERSNGNFSFNITWCDAIGDAGLLRLSQGESVQEAETSDPFFEQQNWDQATIETRILGRDSALVRIALMDHDHALTLLASQDSDVFCNKSRCVQAGSCNALIEGDSSTTRNDGGIDASTEAGMDSSSGGEWAVIALVHNNDDAEEQTDLGGMVQLDSLDIDLGTNKVKNTRQIVGLRFPIALASADRIEEARLQFTSYNEEWDLTSYFINIENSSDAAPFTTSVHDISLRETHALQIEWSPQPWVHEAAGPEQRTPDIAELLRAILSRDDWTPGNHVAFIIEGAGTRTADSRDNSEAKSAKLQLKLAP